MWLKFLVIRILEGKTYIYLISAKFLDNDCLHNDKYYVEAFLYGHLQKQNYVHA